MIGFMPEIYPDELIYSWFCRYLVHSGYSANKMALNDLLFNRHCNPSKEFIGHLNPEMEQIINKMYPTERLVLGHTMFPQYARFIDCQKKMEALYHLGHEFCDAHHLFSILPRCNGDQYLKYCPLCMAEDKKWYGETYWHRQHQLRSLRVCVKHKCRLEDSPIPAKSDHVFVLDPAEDALQDREVRQAENPLELEFAAYITDIFGAPIDFNEETPISSILYFGMKDTKYMSTTGRTRNSRMFAEDMAEFYGKSGMGDTAGYYQIQRTLLGNCSDFLVVSQIAFFLGIPVENLISPSLSREQLQAEKEARCPQKEECPKDWAQYDAEMLPIVEQFAHDVYHGDAGDGGRPGKVSEKLLYKMVGLPSHRLENMPKCREVLNRYSETYGENWARRAVWAYHKLKQDRGSLPIYWSDIRRLAGFKKKNFHLLLPYLEKHSNQETADAIRAMVQTPDEKKQS